MKRLVVAAMALYTIGAGSYLTAQSAPSLSGEGYCTTGFEPDFILGIPDATCDDIIGVAGSWVAACNNYLSGSCSEEPRDVVSANCNDIPEGAVLTCQFAH